MTKNRLEAFSDGVLAIIITIMVLEMKIPHEASWEALAHLIPVLLSYVLSFIFIGIYWNNHHHMVHTLKKVNAKILWSNLHLLFWLSLIPFVTGWMGENHFEPIPVLMYGIVLLGSAIAYFILHHQITNVIGQSTEMGIILSDDRKGKISLLLYLAAILFTFYNQWISCALYVVVAFMWLIPDTRIEKLFSEDE